MKRITPKLIFILVLSLCFLNLKSQNNKNMMENDWIVFQRDFDFSESFKTELAKQLKDKLYTLNNLDKVQENPIRLVIGLEDLNQKILDEYIFASAFVYIKELDEMFPISICWKSKDFSELKNIQKSELSGKKVDFEWCQDFPFVELKKALTNKKVYEKINNLNFIIKPKYYPDLVVNFKLKMPLNNDETELIENIFKKNKKVYVSSFTENIIMLDFQIDTMNFKDEDYYKDIEYLKSSINEISQLEFSNKIENIEIK